MHIPFLIENYLKDLRSDINSPFNNLIKDTLKFSLVNNILN